MFRSFGRNWFEYGQEGQTYKLGQGSVSGRQRNYMFRNDGGGTFSNVGWSLGTASVRDGRGTAIADYDRDGDLDIFLTNNNQASQYFENRVPELGHWSVIQLRGTKNNSHGIGARVRLKAGGRWQVREIHAGSGYLSSPAPEAHFGLGAAATIERIEIRWPTGEVQVLEGPAADRVLVVREHNAVK
jgi:hypothetical protein